MADNPQAKADTSKTKADKSDDSNQPEEKNETRGTIQSQPKESDNKSDQAEDSKNEVQPVQPKKQRKIKPGYLNPFEMPTYVIPARRTEQQKEEYKKIKDSILTQKEQK